MATVAVSAAALTHQGALRARNEDTIALGDWVRSAPMAAPERFDHELPAEGALPVLALVADGMGGHAAGEVASRVVAELLVEQAARAVDGAALAGLLQAVNHRLFETMRARPSLDGMGTTVAGVVVLPTACLVFNVGDSRVYRLDAAGLLQLSTDDTPGPKLADGRTAAIPSHLITQTLGGHYHDEIVPHVLSDPPSARQRYLICSDGVSDLLSLREIAALLEDDAAASARALFEAAMAQGGRDNISLILLEVRRG
jgi:serine/threonine protein phosphatase PrpC